MSNKCLFWRKTHWRCGSIGNRVQSFVFVHFDQKKFVFFSPGGRALPGPVPMNIRLNRRLFLAKDANMSILAQTHNTFKRKRRDVSTIHFYERKTTRVFKKMRSLQTLGIVSPGTDRISRSAVQANEQKEEENKTDKLTTRRRTDFFFRISGTFLIFFLRLVSSLPWLPS